MKTEQFDKWLTENSTKIKEELDRAKTLQYGMGQVLRMFYNDLIDTNRSNELHEAHKLVLKLNDELDSRAHEEGYCFIYETDGYSHSIMLGDIPIWNDSNDEREYIGINHDEIEPLEDFVNNKVASIIEIMSKTIKS